MALGTLLPLWPALLFTYIEPISYILGFNSAFSTPSDFVNKQTPNPSNLTPLSDGTLILSYATANLFLVLASIAILCTAISRDARVTKGYLLIVAIGDLGHLYASYKVMGPDVFWNFNDYNDLMWATIIFTVFLHVNRLATLLGVFGRIGRRAGGV